MPLSADATVDEVTGAKPLFLNPVPCEARRNTCLDLILFGHLVVYNEALSMSSKTEIFFTLQLCLALQPSSLHTVSSSTLPPRRLAIILAASTHDVAPTRASARFNDCESPAAFVFAEGAQWE